MGWGDVATLVKLRHRDTGREKIGSAGYSWTTLFFGPFPALFRGEYLVFLTYFAVAAVILVTLPEWGTFLCLLMSLVWSFNFNPYHLRKLIERGYVLADTAETNRRAAMTVDMPPAAMGARFMSLDLTTDAYRIFLANKYRIEKNEALAYADSLEFADGAPLAPSPRSRFSRPRFHSLTQFQREGREMIVRIAAGVALALSMTACAARPGSVAAPGAPAARLDTVSTGVNVECMQRRMTQNLVRNQFQIGAASSPGQIVADKNGNRSLYTVSQEGPNVRVVLDLYVVGKDGSVAPMAATEVTPAGWANLQRSVDSVADVCRGRSPMGSDTFTINDLKK